MEAGYVIFRNAISPQEIAFARSCFSGSEVKYFDLRTKFIEPILLQRAFKRNVTYFKYRVSDNNNSVDASAFHRDLIPMHTRIPLHHIPCTCLAYLDRTIMELIPGTHRPTAFFQPYKTALNTFQRRVQVTLHPGDILLFHSTLLHRGIFTERLPHRRLIQVFDIIPQNIPIPKIIHVLGQSSKNEQELMIGASRNSFIIPFINSYGFLNAHTGYGLSKTKSSHDFFSSEGLSYRLPINTDKKPGSHPLNMYLRGNAPPSIWKDLPKEQHNTFDWICFRRQYIMYTIAAAIFIIAFITMIVLLSKHTRSAPRS